MLEWLDAQPLAETVTCLGDGHDGIWRFFARVGQPEQREEVLDWYHLIENAYRLRGSHTQITWVRTDLWQGRVENVIGDLRQQLCLGATRFIGYHHRHRPQLANYQAQKEAGLPVGSGCVESLVKQIALRVKLPGAQWSRENIPRVLKHRCAYLNGAFSA